MKKLIVVISLFFVLMVNQPKQNFSLLNYFSGEYCFYTESPISTNYINLGFCFLNKGEENASHILGESMTINNFEPANALKTLRATVVKTEVVNGATIIYARSPIIPSSVTVDGTIINLQIAVYNTHSVIGWPLILGSY